MPNKLVKARTLEFVMRLGGLFHAGLIVLLLCASSVLKSQFVLNGDAVSLGGDCFRLTQALPN